MIKRLGFLALLAIPMMAQDGNCSDMDNDGDGWTVGDGDCNDTDANTHPGATEICDGRDNDCDGAIPADETEDSDGDGVVDCAESWAVEFGGNDWITISDSADLNLTGGMTLAAWFKTTTSTASEIAMIGKHTCGSATGFFLGLNSYYSAPDAAQYYLGENATRLTAAESLNDGAWHHIAGTFDGSSAKLYTDGVLVGEATTSYSATNSLDLVLGVHGATCGGGYYVGVLDEVSIWDTARTLEELTSDMASPLVGDEVGLVAYWDFDGESEQTVTDRSGNGWTGVFGSTSAVEDNDPLWVEDGPF